MCCLFTVGKLFLFVAGWGARGVCVGPWFWHTHHSALFADWQVALVACRRASRPVKAPKGKRKSKMSCRGRANDGGAEHTPPTFLVQARMNRQRPRSASALLPLLLLGRAASGQEISAKPCSELGRDFYLTVTKFAK